MIVVRSVRSGALGSSSPCRVLRVAATHNPGLALLVSLLYKMLNRESLLFSPTRDGVPSSDDDFTAADIAAAQVALEEEGTRAGLSGGPIELTVQHSPRSNPLFSHLGLHVRPRLPSTAFVPPIHRPTRAEPKIGRASCRERVS